MFATVTGENGGFVAIVDEGCGVTLQPPAWLLFGGPRASAKVW